MCGAAYLNLAEPLHHLPGRRYVLPPGRLAQVRVRYRSCVLLLLERPELGADVAGDGRELAVELGVVLADGLLVGHQRLKVGECHFGRGRDALAALGSSVGAVKFVVLAQLQGDDVDQQSRDRGLQLGEPKGGAIDSSVGVGGDVVGSQLVAQRPTPERTLCETVHSAPVRTTAPRRAEPKLMAPLASHPVPVVSRITVNSIGSCARSHMTTRTRTTAHNMQTGSGMKDEWGWYEGEVGGEVAVRRQWAHKSGPRLPSVAGQGPAGRWLAADTAAQARVGGMTVSPRAMSRCATTCLPAPPMSVRLRTTAF